MSGTRFTSPTSFPGSILRPGARDVRLRELWLPSDAFPASPAFNPSNAVHRSKVIGTDACCAFDDFFRPTQTDFRHATRDNRQWKFYYRDVMSNEGNFLSRWCNDDHIDIEVIKATCSVLVSVTFAIESEKESSPIMALLADRYDSIFFSMKLHLHVLSYWRSNKFTKSRSISWILTISPAYLFCYYMLCTIDIHVTPAHKERNDHALRDLTPVKLLANLRTYICLSDAFDDVSLHISLVEVTKKCAALSRG